MRYRAVYPGIDMVFYGNAGQLEYDLIPAPHAGPESVRMRFDGARRLGLEANGDLRIETASGVLWQKKPAVYQAGAARSPAGTWWTASACGSRSTATIRRRGW